MSEPIDEPVEEMPGVEYLPCKLCGSTEYDLANHDEEKLENECVFEPLCCDQCYFGYPSLAGILLQ